MPKIFAIRYRLKFILFPNKFLWIMFKLFWVLYKFLKIIYQHFQRSFWHFYKIFFKFILICKQNFLKPFLWSSLVSFNLAEIFLKIFLFSSYYVIYCSSISVYIIIYFLQITALYFWKFHQIFFDFNTNFSLIPLKCLSDSTKNFLKFSQNFPKIAQFC